jgi:ribosome recycling factor
MLAVVVVEYKTTQPLEQVVQAAVETAQLMLQLPYQAQLIQVVEAAEVAIFQLAATAAQAVQAS